jgi:hypothetical protein
MKIKKIQVSGGGRDVPVRISLMNYDPLHTPFQLSEFQTWIAPLLSGHVSENTISPNGVLERTFLEMCPAPLQSGYSQQAVTIQRFPGCTG